MYNSVSDNVNLTKVIVTYSLAYIRFIDTLLLSRSTVVAGHYKAKRYMNNSNKYMITNAMMRITTVRDFLLHGLVYAGM